MTPVPSIFAETEARIRAKMQAKRDKTWSQIKANSYRTLSSFSAAPLRGTSADTSVALTQAMIWSKANDQPIYEPDGGLYGLDYPVRTPSVPLGSPSPRLVFGPQTLFERRHGGVPNDPRATDKGAPIVGGINSRGTYIEGGLWGARDEAYMLSGNALKIYGDEVCLVGCRAYYLSGIASMMEGRDLYSSVSSVYMAPEGGGGNRIHGGPFLVENCYVSSSDDANQCQCYSYDLIGIFRNVVSVPQQGAFIAVYNFSPESTARVLVIDSRGVMRRDPVVVGQQVTGFKIHTAPSSLGDLNLWVIDSRQSHGRDQSKAAAVQVWPNGAGTIRANFIRHVVSKPLGQGLNIADGPGNVEIVWEGGKIGRPRTAGLSTISRLGHHQFTRLGDAHIRGVEEVRDQQV